MRRAQRHSFSHSAVGDAHGWCPKRSVSILPTVSWRFALLTRLSPCIGYVSFFSLSRSRSLFLSFSSGPFFVLAVLCVCFACFVCPCPSASVCSWGASPLVSRRCVIPGAVFCLGCFRAHVPNAWIQAVVGCTCVFHYLCDVDVGNVTCSSAHLAFRGSCCCFCSRALPVCHGQTCWDIIASRQGIGKQIGSNNAPWGKPRVDALGLMHLRRFL